MRLIFAGTPVFAREALAALLTAGHEVCLVLTQPDRPAGRGLKLQASPVKQLALEHHIPVAQPRSLRLDGRYPEDAQQARDVLQACGALAMVVAAYGLILPDWVLALPPRGCLNIHASLLPRWRGAAPIHRAIEAGDRESGITIMQMDAGLDTGDMLMMHKLPITPTDTTTTLHDRMADLGGKLIALALEQAAAGQLRPVPQPTEGVTYAHKIEKHEAAIDWTQDAATIVRRVRAFNPFPGATATLNGETIKVWGARVGAAADMPSVASGCGHIVAVARDGIAVAAMNSVAILTELQRPGGKRLAVADFLRGFELQSGMRFELLPAGAPPT